MMWVIVIESMGMSITILHVIKMSIVKSLLLAKFDQLRITFFELHMFVSNYHSSKVFIQIMSKS